MKFAWAFLLLLCAGCATQRMNLPPAPEKVTAPAAAPAKGDGDSTSSMNALQQDITGIGLNLGKLTESFKVMDALAQFKTEIAATFQAALNVAMSVRVDQKVDVSARADVNAKAFSDINARLDRMEFTINQRNQVDVDGVAALKSEIQKMNNDVSAGRDAHFKIVQFTKEMQNTLVESYNTQLKTVIYFCGALTTIVSTIITVLAGVITTVVTTLCVAMVKLSTDSRKRESQRHEQTRTERDAALAEVVKLRSLIPVQA